MAGLFDGFLSGWNASENLVGRVDSTFSTLSPDFAARSTQIRQSFGSLFGSELGGNTGGLDLVAAPADESVANDAGWDWKNLGSVNPVTGIAKFLLGGAAEETGTPVDLGGVDPLGDAANEWFVRGIVIILGFIFVAVGLSLFRAPAVVTQAIAGK